VVRRRSIAERTFELRPLGGGTLGGVARQAEKQAVVIGEDIEGECARRSWWPTCALHARMLA